MLEQYEQITPESIREEIFAALKTDIDTREGSFAGDVVAPTALELWKVYQSLSAIVPIAYPDETSGPYIDKKCQNYGIVRKEGSRALVTLRLTGTPGTVVRVGRRFRSATGLVFATLRTVTLEEKPVEVEAQAEGEGGAYNLPAGTITIQETALYGLSAVTNPQPAQGGSDPESDKALVERLYAHLRQPASSGNLSHYEQWAAEAAGVQGVRVDPLWDGPGTVRVVVAGEDLLPVDEEIVGGCTAHLEELRPIGAAVTVQSVQGKETTLQASLELEEGADLETIRAGFSKGMEEYLRTLREKRFALAFRRKPLDQQTLWVAYYQAAALLMEQPGVRDIRSLTLGGGEGNLEIGPLEVPVLGEVTLS